MYYGYNQYGILDSANTTAKCKFPICPFQAALPCDSNFQSKLLSVVTIDIKKTEQETNDHLGCFQHADWLSCQFLEVATSAEICDVMNGVSETRFSE